MVVEGSAQVELPERLVLHGECLWVNDCQLVVAQIQRAKAAESGKRVGLHLGDSGFEKIQEISLSLSNHMATFVVKIKLSFELITSCHVTNIMKSA